MLYTIPGESNYFFILQTRQTLKNKKEGYTYNTALFSCIIVKTIS